MKGNHLSLPSLLGDCCKLHLLVGIDIGKRAVQLALLQLQRDLHKHSFVDWQHADELTHSRQQWDLSALLLGRVAF